MIRFQVPRYWLPAYSLFQLSQLTEMQRMYDGTIYGRRGLVDEGGLQTELVQVRGHGISVRGPV